MCWRTSSGSGKGRGFNQIRRPNQAADRFLELNETIETLEFREIPGDIPNRGLGLLGQPDINLHGLTYLQQVQDSNVPGPNGKPAGIHVEPGIWINIPPTTNPSDPSTGVRLANIPHGTSLLRLKVPPADYLVRPRPLRRRTSRRCDWNPASLIPFPNETRSYSVNPPHGTG